MNQRRAYSLVELLVVIAGSSVVLATAVSLLHGIFQAERIARQRAAIQQTLRRLAADFRDDAHASVKLVPTEIVLDDKKVSAWEFQMPKPDRSIRYHAATPGLVREERVSGKLVRREAYRLPEGARISLQSQAGPPSLAVLRIGQGLLSEKVGALPFRVDAALGSDLRFARTEGKSR